MSAAGNQAAAAGAGAAALLAKPADFNALKKTLMPGRRGE